MNAVTETVAAEPVSGVEIFVPLAKLKKSPRNARKVPHGDAAIEALAASIQHKGLIQNLVVEPEVKADGEQTGCYLVTAGEGRRLAMLLRAKRKQIKKSEPVRCWLDTANDPSEISLDENVTRTPMHPADQFERFAELGEASVQAFETEGLVGAGSAAAVLSYLFHRIEGRLDGSPTLIIIDEGWLVLDSPDFAAQLREWLKTLRKKNASVVLT